MEVVSEVPFSRLISPQSFCPFYLQGVKQFKVLLKWLADVILPNQFRTRDTEMAMWSMPEKHFGITGIIKDLGNKSVHKNYLFI